jgi:hypothetical protein
VLKLIKAGRKRNNSKFEAVPFTRHWLENEFLFVSVGEFLEMLIDEPDAFDPDEQFRDEDGMWDIKFAVHADLKRDAHCKIGSRVIVHDEARVYDVMQLGLQAIVHPSLFSYSAQIILKAADVLIAHGRTKGAEALIESFLAGAEQFSLSESASTPVIARLGKLQIIERVFSHAVRTVIIGHEIGHYLVHGRTEVPDESEEIELQCDSVGLDAAFFFDEHYMFPIVVDTEDGPEPCATEGLSDAWGAFEHLATALFFGDALVRSTAGFLNGKTVEVFSLATRRCEATIAKFRSSEIGRRPIPRWMPSASPLKRAFLDVATFVGRTIDLQDDRFVTVHLPNTPCDMSIDSTNLRSSFFERLHPLGLRSTLKGVLLPEKQEGSGLQRWEEVVDRSTAKPQRPRSRPMLS